LKKLLPKKLPLKELSSLNSLEESKVIRETLTFELIPETQLSLEESLRVELMLIKFLGA
jgi:hypothetical protein